MGTSIYLFRSPIAALSRRVGIEILIPKALGTPVLEFIPIKSGLRPPCTHDSHDNK